MRWVPLSLVALLFNYSYLVCSRCYCSVLKINLQWHIFVLIFARCSYQFCLKIMTIYHTRSECISLGRSLQVQILLQSPMVPFATPIWRYKQRKTILEIFKLARCSERTHQENRGFS